MLSCEFWEISKNVFSYRTPLVAASAKLTGKHQCDSSFLKKGCRSQACNIVKKKILAQVFSCELREEYLFYRTAAVATSVADTL